MADQPEDTLDPKAPVEGDKPDGAEETLDEAWDAWEKLDAGDAASEDDDPSDPLDTADEEDTTADGPIGEGAGDPPGDADTIEGDKPDLGELEAQIARLTEENEDLKKRRGGEGHKIKMLQRDLKTTKKRLAAAEGAKQAQESSKESLEAAAEEYPDVLKPVQDNLNAVQGSMEAQAEAERETVSNLEGDLQAELIREAQVFQAEHPEGMKFVVDHIDAFNAWIRDQPGDMRDIHQANLETIQDGKGAALLVSKFKQAVAAATEEPSAGDDPVPATDTSLEERRQRQLDGARGAPSTPSSKLLTTDTEDDPNESPDDSWDYWERKDAEAERRRA